MEQLQLDGIYKSLFDSIGEGLLIVNSEGDIELANPRCYEMFNYEENELIGLKVEDLIPSASREKHVGLRKDYQENPHKRRMGGNMNLHACKKNGELFHVEISLNHFTANKKKFVIAIITDISERVLKDLQIQELNANLEKKVEERTKEVMESQKLYSAIAKNFPNGTINVFDQNLCYLFVEGLELQELGVKKESLIGTSYLDKISQDIRPKIEKELREVFSGINKDFEIFHNQQFYRITAVPLSNEEIDKILVVEENITIQKTIEQQREEALKKEKHLNEMKSRFVSMASHEFRTPLSTVLSSVSLIDKYLEKGEIDKTSKHTKRVRSAVAGLTEILNDFLSVEKLESNLSESKIEQFNYREFAKDMVEEMMTISKSGQNIQLIFEGDDWMISSDSKILKNILYNLLSNAIKYSNEGQQVIFKSHRNDVLIISVQDFGIGIPEEEQKSLFERFFRAKNVTNIKGTGLGLNIVKKYVEILKGEITFESKLNEGTTFTVKIPIKNE